MGAPIPITDAFSHESSVYNASTGPVTITDAVSREFSVYNDPARPVTITDAVSREFSVYHDPTGSVTITDAVSRELTVYLLGPDLRVTDFAAPVRGLTDETLTVSWTVRNSGQGFATGTWVDRVYIWLDRVHVPAWSP